MSNIVEICRGPVRGGPTVDTFDELRFIVFHEKFQEFDIEKFPPTLASIR